MAPDAKLPTARAHKLGHLSAQGPLAAALLACVPVEATVHVCKLCIDFDHRKPHLRKYLKIRPHTTHGATNDPLCANPPVAEGFSKIESAMAPLILHNVPDEECYVGDDGIKRPYAMIFNQSVFPPNLSIIKPPIRSSLTPHILTIPCRHDGSHTGNTRSRRTVAESGSFGKSTRRSRSRTGTPAGRRENPTLAAADKLFGDWVSNQTAANTSANSNGRKGNAAAANSNSQEDAAPQRAAVQSTPVEVILRGFRSSSQQYASIAHYEALAGLILEDYPRDPPSSQRRYKSELRDPAFTRRRNLTADERTLVNRADGGEHWIKVTFESTEAGNAALYSSPQRVLGHLVYAEAYRGFPPAKDEPCPDLDQYIDGPEERSRSVPSLGTPRNKTVTGMPTTFSSRLLDLSPADSGRSSETMDTGTLAPSRTSTATLTEPIAISGAASGIEPMDIPQQEDSIFCRRIPTARKARLLPAEQALLPQQSVTQRFLNAIPIIKWFSGSMIGNEVPRTETGDFDWSRASLYWKVIWWLDSTFGLFKGDVYNIDKDD